MKVDGGKEGGVGGGGMLGGRRNDGQKGKTRGG